MSVLTFHDFFLPSKIKKTSTYRTRIPSWQNFFLSCLFQRVKNFNYSGQLKHREETTIKISIQCEVLIAWWLWLKFEKQIQRETKGSFDFSSEAACHGYDARSLSDIRQFCFPLGFNLNDSKVIPFFLRQQCDFYLFAICEVSFYFRIALGITMVYHYWYQGLIT